MNTGKRRDFNLLFLIPLFWLSSLLAQTAIPVKPAAEARLALHEGWSLQTSAKVEAHGRSYFHDAIFPEGMA